MRLALAVLAVLLLAGYAEAQETYSIAANASQVTRLTRSVTGANRNACQAYNLPATCTQAQVCTAAGTPGGASCTAAQARAANVRIWPVTQAGREEFITFELVLNSFRQLTALAAVQDNADMQAACKASTVTRDQLCTTSGLPTACDLCPITP